MTTDPVADFLAKCEKDWTVTYDLYQQRKKLVAMVRVLREQVMLDMQPNEQLARIIEV